MVGFLRVNAEEEVNQSAVDSRAEFVDSFRDGTTSLNATELEEFNQGTIASGVETTEDDIDDILYG